MRTLPAFDRLDTRTRPKREETWNGKTGSLKKRQRKKETVMRIRNVVVAVGFLAIVLAAAVARAEGPAPEGPGPVGPGPFGHLREELLKKFDTDGDGQLNDAERAAAREALKQRIAEEKQKFLEKWDKDGDGTLSDAEKAAAREALGQRIREEVQARRQEFIKKWDTDGDGKLSEEERKAALDSLPEDKRQEILARHQKALEEFDADGDGKLNDQERAAARDALRERIKDRLDRNDDGKVGPIERRMGVRQWQRRNGGGGPSGPRPGADSGE
jgi:Ca2+-binding EF-hand superfamily protein